MKILVVGVGAVGGYFGGRLAAAGEDVIFAARGASAQALRDKGLRLRSPFGDATIEQPRLLEDPLDVGLVDVVLLCTKLDGLREAARLVEPLLAPDTAVIPLQNGLIGEKVIAETLGPRHAVGGVAYIAAELAEPGLVRHEGGFAKLALGELDGAKSRRLDALSVALEAAGIPVDYSDNIMEVIWHKYIGLSAFSAATTFYRSAIGPIMADPERRAFYGKLLDESAAVARAEGVALADDHGATLLKSTENYPETMTSSMLQDCQRGKALELDYLSGTIVSLGERHDIATPAHQSVVAALDGLKAGSAA